MGNWHARKSNWHDLEKQRGEQLAGPGPVHVRPGRRHRAPIFKGPIIYLVYILGPILAHQSARLVSCLLLAVLCRSLPQSNRRSALGKQSAAWASRCSVLLLLSAKQQKLHGARQQAAGCSTSSRSSPSQSANERAQQSSILGLSRIISSKVLSFVTNILRPS